MSSQLDDWEAALSVNVESVTPLTEAMIQEWLKKKDAFKWGDSVSASDAYSLGWQDAIRFVEHYMRESIRVELVEFVPRAGEGSAPHSD